MSKSLQEIMRRNLKQHGMSEKDIERVMAADLLVPDDAWESYRNEAIKLRNEHEIKYSTIPNDSVPFLTPEQVQFQKLKARAIDTEIVLE